MLSRHYAKLLTLGAIKFITSLVNKNILFLLLLCSIGRMSPERVRDISGTSLPYSDSSYFKLDTSLRSSILNKVRLISKRHFSQFVTSVKAKFYNGDVLSDSIMDVNGRVDSWYSNRGDTIDLVAHVGFFENEAFLVRFIGNKANVYLFRAAHDPGTKYFKKKPDDSLTYFVEVPAVFSQLIISEIPNLTNRPVVFGHIKMTSDTYYDDRDSSLLPHHDQLEFYFRSQYYGSD
jgi:hypothetical protein